MEIPKEKYGVHQAHCCIEHGCKYGDKNCPVITGEIKQFYYCEDCVPENLDYGQYGKDN